MLRNGWPEWSGMGGRNQAEYADRLKVLDLRLEFEQKLALFKGLLQMVSIVIIF